MNSILKFIYPQGVGRIQAASYPQPRGQYRVIHSTLFLIPYCKTDYILLLQCVR